jgi:hypothetical protein
MALLHQVSRRYIHVTVLRVLRVPWQDMTQQLPHVLKLLLQNQHQGSWGPRVVHGLRMNYVACV